MNTPSFEDRLEILGILVGAFVVIVGVGTLSGLPWTTTNDLVASLIQIVGIVATIAIGLVLMRIAYTGEPRDLLPSE